MLVRMWKLEPLYILYIIGGNVKWCNHFRKVWQFLKVLITIYDLYSIPSVYAGKFKTCSQKPVHNCS